MNLSEMIERDREQAAALVARRGHPICFMNFPSPDPERPFVVVGDNWPPMADDGYFHPPAARPNAPLALTEHAKLLLVYATGLGGEFYVYLTLDCRCHLIRKPDGWWLTLRLRYETGRHEDYEYHAPLADAAAITVAIDQWIDTVLGSVVQGRGAKA